MVNIKSIACLLGVFSLGSSAVVETAKVGLDAAAWKLTEFCIDYYTVSSGDTCWDIISRNQNKFTMRQLLCWNTDINPWCSNLIPGRQVCIGVDLPGPVC
ncbi:uncharacterized protein N7511_009642 [Penicillium nucicola]|uniref:uncharacterized protein n=1 Tax=Penicillium nucicola TaxID=1850975 RepID=UPI0025454652|nr:uncharacterized protein N7511_009642 [Penicillium nucicola]KAJ5747946.1 hypothetical protein N7511_009642 [Penicillium nucicola]